MNKTVLVVAKFEGIRKIIQNNLEKKGITVLAVENIKLAETFFDGRQINMIMCDCDTTESESYEIIKKIRDNVVYEFIPILIISTKKKSDNLDKIEQLKIAGWLQKPFDVKEFDSFVNRYIR